MDGGKVPIRDDMGRHGLRVAKRPLLGGIGEDRMCAAGGHQPSHGAGAHLNHIGGVSAITSSLLQAGRATEPDCSLHLTGIAQRQEFRSVDLGG